MKIDKAKVLLTAAKLRRKAEKQVQAKMTKPDTPRTSEEILKLTHELEVYQVELVMQVEELRETRDEFESALGKYVDLFDFAPNGYFILSRNGTINSVNYAGASLLGVERSELIGRRLGLFVGDELRPSFAEYLDKVFSGQGKETCEVTLTGKEHSPLFVHVEGVTLGTGEECRITVIDITERKWAEVTLDKLNKTLEMRISNAVDEIRRKDQAMIRQNALAAMGEMINNIAHQWRQPVNNVGMIVQLIQMEYDAGELTSDDMNSRVENVMEILMQMSHTIDDFRNFFQVDKEKNEFLVSEAVDHAMSLVSASLKSHNIHVEIKSDDDMTVNGYHNEYSQVLLNLFSNACDACLERNKDNSHINIHITQENERSVLYFRDDCGGIPEEVLPKIFDPYFTTRGPNKGTGIGLYMSRIIIEQNMYGRLTARNFNGGAEFRIEV